MEIQIHFEQTLLQSITLYFNLILKYFVQNFGGEIIILDKIKNTESQCLEWIMVRQRGVEPPARWFDF